MSVRKGTGNWVVRAVQALCWPRSRCQTQGERLGPEILPGLGGQDGRQPSHPADVLQHRGELPQPPRAQPETGGLLRGPARVRQCLASPPGESRASVVSQTSSAPSCLCLLHVNFRTSCISVSRLPPHAPGRSPVLGAAFLHSPS